MLAQGPGLQASGIKVHDLQSMQPLIEGQSHEPRSSLASRITPATAKRGEGRGPRGMVSFLFTFAHVDEAQGYHDLTPNKAVIVTYPDKTVHLRCREASAVLLCPPFVCRSCQLVPVHGPAPRARRHDDTWARPLCPFTAFFSCFLLGSCRDLTSGGVLQHASFMRGV